MALDPHTLALLTQHLELGKQRCLSAAAAAGSGCRAGQHYLAVSSYRLSDKRCGSSNNLDKDQLRRAKQQLQYRSQR